MAAAMGIERLFVVTDPGIIQFGLLQQAVESLEANNIALHIYSDIVADPPESVVMNAVHAAQDFGCDGVDWLLVAAALWMWPNC
jgi:alcohol dehydrogenase